MRVGSHLSGSTLPFDRTAYDGFIFDCDGTLADSMPVHYRAWSTTLQRSLGRPAAEITPLLFQACGGLPAREILQRWNEDFGYDLPIEATVEAKAEVFLEIVEEVQPIPVIVSLLKQLGPGGRVAVASSGLTRVIDRIVAHIGLTVGPAGDVQTVVCADQVARGKPAPDIFLRAAERLESPPRRCLVFEDAESGFEAARRAGMDYLDVRPLIGPP